MLKRKIVWDIEEAENLAAPMTQERDPEVSSVKLQSVPEPEQKRVRNGNGHVIAKKRRLNDDEKDFIRKAFRIKDGCIGEDDCVDMLDKGPLPKPRVSTDPPLSIFQITGFVSYLHREVRKGKIELSDPSRYDKFLREKYGTPDPEFTAFIKPRQEHKRTFRYST